MPSKNPPPRPPRSWPSTPTEEVDGQREKSPQIHQAPSNEMSSLDIPQRIERKLAQYNASQNVVKRWMFEIISWTTSAACMAAIIGILVYLKDEPLSKWPFGLTINTVLSKVASAALILPISEAIGQLKWTWFTKSNEMFDFEIFDKASRGPWGSAMLLLRTKGKSLAALGALLTLLLLAIDTFFQQVTDLSERWTLHGNSSIPRIVRYNPDYGLAFKDGAELMQDDPYLTTVMHSFFYSNGSEPTTVGNGTQASVPMSCPTSRCEWEPYETLGVCSACADISSLLSFACLDIKLDWLSSLAGYGTVNTPNGTACGYFLNATSSEPVLMSGYRAHSNDSNAAPGEALLMRALPLVKIDDRETLFGGSINFKQMYFPLVNALIVSAADGSASSVYRHEPPIAQECMLSWCVKTIKSSYSWGGYKEEVLDKFMNTSGLGLPYPWKTVLWQTDSDWTATDHFFNANLSIYTPNTDRSGSGFGVSNYTFVNTVGLLDEMFPSVTTVLNATGIPRMRIQYWKEKQNNIRFADKSPWLVPGNIGPHMDNLATTLTNVVRSYAAGNEPVIGKAYASITFVSVKWAWLTFPLTLLFLCLVFLAATIYKISSAGSQDTAVWKTSAMPTLIYSLPKDLQKEFTSPSTWTDSSNLRSKKVRVKLLPNKGWRVSGQVYTPTTPSFPRSQAPPGWI